MLSTLPTMLSTPTKNGKVKVRAGPSRKLRRQPLDRSQVVPRRLIFPNMNAKFGRGAEPEPEPLNRELDTGNFEGPGWECSSISQAGAGRYYKGIVFYCKKQ
jgi:hypothetical protein